MEEPGVEAMHVQSRKGMGRWASSRTPCRDLHLRAALCSLAIVFYRRNARAAEARPDDRRLQRDVTVDC